MVLRGDGVAFVRREAWWRRRRTGSRQSGHGCCLIEDPQQLGKDIGSGTYNIRNVQQLFAAAAGTLRDCMDQQTEQNQWAAVQVLMSLMWFSG